MATSSLRLLLCGAIMSFAIAAGSAQDDLKPDEAALIETENDVTTKKGAGAWEKATPTSPLAAGDRIKTGKKSRAAVRLSDRSVMRLDQLTVFEIGAAQAQRGGSSIDLQQGAAYIFSRERTPEVRITTPAANGALRGTQLMVRVTPGKTMMTVFEGEVDLSNAHGSVSISSGEQGEVEIGKAPRKTAGIYAANILQWALYYPGVLDPAELGMTAADQRAVGASLAAYRAGDLLGALEKYPNIRPGSPGARLYHAGVLLAVGRVDEARATIAGVSAASPGRAALEQMIAAVKFEDWAGPAEPRTAGEWTGRSYYRQSKSDLEAARDAARQATLVAPSFGYAWVRLAEMEFSFGRTPQALKALERGLQLSPRNAQGHALRGFLLSAQNRIDAARAAFEEAIALDGALGNAWLGRGLTSIRKGHDEVGRQDLQVAAALEPNRSILHSYLGKAFSQVGDTSKARKDFARAKELDPNDPTPWLYSALQNKQENRYNEAIDDLEKSLALNENRRVYRSKLLLDQDRGVRGTNLASVYLNNGMVDLSVREATRAVDADYANASAHLFLANSFDALRDPRRILLRYETAWFNELLLSHLLSPVGGGSLSQFVSQQEYSKLFEADGLGVSSLTEFSSNGELRQNASQYGTFGNISYALDAEYLYSNGIRPNNRLRRFEGTGTFKFQITPQDTVFLQGTYLNAGNGDVFQRFDVDDVGREKTVRVIDPATGELRKIVQKNTPALTFGSRERQDPGLLLLGYHHEWAPGIHTLALFGRLADRQSLKADDTNQLIFQRDVGSVDDLLADDADPARPLKNRDVLKSLQRLRGTGAVSNKFDLGLDFDYHSDFEIYSAELNQIATVGPQTFVFGGRYQKGTFDTEHTFSGLSAANQDSGAFLDPPSRQDVTADFERVSLYAYDIWRATRWLSLTAGVTYDTLRYPENFRTPPLDDKERSFGRTSPKAGFILSPFWNLVLRGAYAEAISGASFDESVRLEPTQIAGFSQAYRTIVSEDIFGSVAGATYKSSSLSLEQKLPTRTYWGLEYNVLTQDLDRSVGVFDFITDKGAPLAVLPSQTEQKVVYREDILTATLNQLVGDRWSLGSRYRYSKAKLRQDYRDVANTLFATADTTRSSVLHEVDLFALYNHPSGFFARGEARWFSQENDGFPRDAAKPRNDPRPGDEFWQLNAIAGWRFYRNQGELSGGILNITGTDYQLEPLNYYLELPRERTVFVRLKFTF